jgi:hypothetical protein
VTFARFIVLPVALGCTPPVSSISSDFVDWVQVGVADAQLEAVGYGMPLL